MTTPICKTCGAKFPGRDICKACGSDPIATPTVTARIERATAAVRTLNAQAAKSGMLTPEYREYERRVTRARTRSIVATPKRRKHGRHV